MAQHFLYRINGSGVIGSSVSNTHPWQEIDTTYFQVVTDPNTPDGVDLSVPKIYDAPDVRNATAPEISGFSTAATEDQTLIDRETAKSFLTTNPIQKKILSAMFKEIITEIDNRILLSPRTLGAIQSDIFDRIDSGSED